MQSKYRVIFDDPDQPDEASCILVPAPEWMDEAMSGKLPPLHNWYDLQDAEQKAIDEGRHQEFKHDPEMYDNQFTAPRIGPLTEEQAIEYLCLKDLPRRCFTEVHNRPMFKIVTVDQIPKDRTFRNAWEMGVE